LIQYYLYFINNVIGIHPKAILDVERLPAYKREEIKRRARGYASPKEFFVEKLVEGVSTIAAAFWPNPVIVRLSDFKSNEYFKLLGGDLYEPEEENSMLGFRGASTVTPASSPTCSTNAILPSRCCWPWPSLPPTRWANTSASAARARPITPIWPNG